MLRLGVDAWNLLADRRGIGRYTRALLREWTTTFRDDVQVTLLVPQWPAWAYAAAYRREAGDLPLRVRSRAAANSAHFDALWFPWNGLSWSARRPSVAVLHDASLFALDMPAELREHELRPFRRAVAERAHVITDSFFSKHELIRYLGLSPEDVDVVLPGVDLPPQTVLSFGRPPLDFDAPYLLFVGEFEARKGVDVLIAASALLPPEIRARTALVFAGDTRGQSRPVANLKTALLGRVDEDTLSALYRGAAALVYPSRYEGFGLPILEAMAHGAPVVASDAAGIPEAGGDVARYFKNGDATDLARVLLEVLRDPTQSAAFRERGKARARAMPWTNTARKTLEIFGRVASF